MFVVIIHPHIQITFDYCNLHYT